MPKIESSETLDVRGTLNLTGATVNWKSGIVSRAAQAEQSASPYSIHLDNLRVWDDLSALLPGSASSDDLAIIEGVFGTDAPTVQTSDAKATSATQRARFQFSLPENYISGDDITVRVRGGMITTVSDTTATVDVECYAHDTNGGVGSDLCTTAAQSINNLTKANYDFTITPTGLSGGDVLDIRLTIAITDAATVTAVIGEISKVSVLLDVR